MAADRAKEIQRFVKETEWRMTPEQVARIPFAQIEAMQFDSGKNFGGSLDGLLAHMAKRKKEREAAKQEDD